MTGVNGQQRVFRFYQQTPSPAEHVVALNELRLTPTEVSAQKQLAPFSLATTEHAGVFWYRDEQGRTGWMRLENFYNFEVDDLQQLIVVEQLSEAAGVPEPWSQDRPALTLGQPRTGNPYVLMVTGAVLIGVAGFGVVRALADGDGSLPWTIALVMMVLLIALAVAVIIRGAMRLRWWRRTRAEAKRRGIALPDKLTGLGI